MPLKLLDEDRTSAVLATTMPTSAVQKLPPSLLLLPNTYLRTWPSPRSSPIALLLVCNSLRSLKARLNLLPRSFRSLWKTAMNAIFASSPSAAVSPLGPALAATPSSTWYARKSGRDLCAIPMRRLMLRSLAGTAPNAATVTMVYPTLGASAEN